MLRIVFAAVPPIQIVDLTAPFEVFARAGGYRVELVSNAPNGRIRSSSGLTLCEAKDYRKLRGDVDTLLLPGGDGAEEIACDTEFLSWLKSMSGRVRRIGSICTGAMLLAAAGILDDRRAVTHWRWCTRLKREFPRVLVEHDPIYIKDGHVYTSAGVTAGIDLALALVEEDLARRASSRHRSRPGDLSAAHRWAISIQQPAERAVERSPPDRRPGAMDLRESHGGPECGVASGAMRDEPAPVRARIRSGEENHAGPFRRTNSRGCSARPVANRGREYERGRHALRIRQRGFHAPVVFAHAGRDCRRLQFEVCVSPKYNPSARISNGESTPFPVKSAHTTCDACSAGFQLGSGELVKQSLHRYR